MMNASSILRRTAFAKNILRRGGDHHHELTIFNEGPPSKGQILRWFAFLAGVPTAATLFSYYINVVPRIRAKWAADAAGEQ